MTDCDDLKSLFQKKSYVHFGADAAPPKQYLRTGILPLDRALGGGLLCGRFYEFFGPADTGKTTLCGTIMKSAQRHGWIPAFVDLECKTHPQDLQDRFGLSEDYIYCRPPSGEEAVDFISTFIRGEKRLVIVDSLACLVPQTELAKDIDEAPKIGWQASFVSKALRMLVSPLGAQDNIIIFINQVRSSIGGPTGGGCLPGKTKIVLADQSLMSIEEIVENQLPVEVLTLDHQGQLTTKTVTNWFKNGSTNKWHSIRYRDRVGFLRATSNHVIPTKNGEKQVKDITADDTVTTINVRMDDWGHTVVTALLLVGIAQISPTSRCTAKLVIKFKGISEETRAWLCNQLEILELRCYGASGVYESRPRHDLYDLAQEFYAQNNLTIPRQVEITPAIAGIIEAVAAGQISIRNFLTREDIDSIHNLQFLLESFTQVTGDIRIEGVDLKWGSDTADKLRSELPDQPAKQELVTRELQVQSNDLYVNQRFQVKYDIEVVDTHCYFASMNEGSVTPVLVHNSITPGGNQAKHTMTGRLQLARMSTLKGKDGSEVGLRCQVKIKKNHGPGSKRSSIEYDITRERGIWAEDVLGEELLLEEMIIRKGAWYSFSPEIAAELSVPEKIGQGKSSVAEFLEANPEIYALLSERLMSLPAI